MDDLANLHATSRVRSQRTARSTKKKRRVTKLQHERFNTISHSSSFDEPNFNDDDDAGSHSETEDFLTADSILKRSGTRSLAATSSAIAIQSTRRTPALEEDSDESDDEIVSPSRVKSSKRKHQRPTSTADLKHQRRFISKHLYEVRKLKLRVDVVEKTGKGKTADRRRKSKDNKASSKLHSRGVVKYAASPPASAYISSISAPSTLSKSREGKSAANKDLPTSPSKLHVDQSEDTSPSNSYSRDDDTPSFLQFATGSKEWQKSNSGGWLLEDPINKPGRSLLVEAINAGDIARVKELIEKGASVNQPDQNGLTPLQCAFKRLDAEAVWLLLKNNVDISGVDEYENTALHSCVINYQQFGCLLSDFLDRQVINVNQKNKQGNTALCTAAFNGDVQSITKLLSCGADVDCRNNRGSTPLMMACDTGSFEAVALLLEYGTDLSLVDADGNSALHRAVKAFKSSDVAPSSPHMEIVSSLLSRRIDIQRLNHQNKKAIDLCKSTRLQRVLEDWDPSTKSWRWEIQPSLLKYSQGDALGSGKYGTVFRGRLRGTPVAVKIMRTDNRDNKRVFQEFKYEAGLMSDIRHPNILIMLGTFNLRDKDNTFGIITEYLPRGSLNTFLAAEGNTLSFANMLKISVTTCRGLAWLHGLTPPVLHRDLHTKNILITDSCEAKVCDFGLSQLQGSSIEKKALYQRIQPPELIDSPSTSYSKASDVYMFGLVLYELLTRQTALREIVDSHHLAWVKQFYGFDPLICEYVDVIETCCFECPDIRPTFENIIERLDKIIDQMELQRIEVGNPALFTTPLKRGPTFETDEGYTTD